MNVIANIARMSSTTTGTGTLTLGSAVLAALTFDQAGITNGQEVSYAIEDYDVDGNVVAREVGKGTYATSGTTLARTTVYASTNAGAAINCTGRQHVFVTALKEDFDTLLTSAAAASAYQPLDSDLTTLAANITAFGHSLVDDANAGAARTTLGLGTMAVETAADYLTTAAAGAGYQPLDADLTTIAANITAAGHAILDDADASAQRTTLGLGTAATQNTGTSGATIPFLNGTNSWSGANTFTQNLLVQKASANSSIVATTGDSTQYVAAASGQAATTRWMDWNGSAQEDRWLFGKDATAESGANAGSNLACYRYDDTGAFLAALFTASRADGSVNWRGGLYSNGVTGGSQGNGTINFATLYENGTSLAAKYQGIDTDLTALAGLSTSGFIARTGSGTASTRTITGPAAGITVTNGDGVSGNPTLALANDLAALEALSGTNTIYYRSGADTWSSVTIGSNLTFSGGTLSATGGGGGITLGQAVAAQSMMAMN